MNKHKILLYGANGYTGTLIAKMAKEYKIQPILCGRNKMELEELAKIIDTDFLIADLNNAEDLDKALINVPLVLHAAGPFKHTAKQMIEACIRTQTHYIDITGEIEVFELAKQYDSAAKQAGITIMSGVGFDVVPTDCLALFLKNKMPNATDLKLAFASLGGGLSKGTATTMAENAGGKSAERINGKMVSVPLGHKGMWVDFGLKKLFVISIPWGDVSTAYHTTSIPNIVTYTAASPKTFKILKFQKLFNWLLRTQFMKNIQLRKINNKPAGPSNVQRQKSKSLVWGEVKNKEGEIVQARLIGPEGYTLTAITSLIIAKKILEGNFKTGYQTPAGCYGPDLILEVPNVTREILN
jgi:short subunit dehydrogenase-like uncharacterized protein